MGTTEIVVLVVVVLVVLAALAAYLAAQKKKRQREQLRSTFGPEYDRTVDSSGRRRDAEKDLAARADRRSSLDIRPLPAADRQAFAARWTETQGDFVDRPAEAVTSADTLVTEVMRQRGYPVGDFDQQARDLSVDHAQVIQEYRSAHDISLLNDRQQATTEQLRQAMVHYRTLFTELLGDDDVASAAPPVYPTGTGRSDHDDVDSTSYRETRTRSLDDRDAVVGTSSSTGMSDDDRFESRGEQRFEANHDGPYDRSYDDSATRAGHPASSDVGYDDDRDGARDGTLSGGASDPGYATDEDRRTREGGLLASDRDRDQQQVLHVRRERLDDDRDLPPRG